VVIDKLEAQGKHMAFETKARANPPTSIEDDYQAFSAALSESARGREFLAEYARRNRHADTETVLAALERLESNVSVQIAAPQIAPPQADLIRQELRALLAAIRTTTPEPSGSSSAIRAAKLAALLGFVEHRIEAIVAPLSEQSVLPDEVATLLLPERAAEAARSVLAVVPTPDEPELPIPAPAAAQPVEIALVREATEMLEVTFNQPPQALAAKPETVAVVAFEPIELPVVAKAEVPALKTADTLPSVDPLAAIMALSEVERMALFT
jgi:hypothetical protein